MQRTPYKRPLSYRQRNMLAILSYSGPDGTMAWDASDLRTLRSLVTRGLAHQDGWRFILGAPKVAA